MLNKKFGYYINVLSKVQSIINNNGTNIKITEAHYRLVVKKLKKIEEEKSIEKQKSNFIYAIKNTPGLENKIIIETAEEILANPKSF